MAEWMVRLKGEGFVLEELSQYGLPEWSIAEEDGEYYLRCAAFTGLTDAREVRDIALGVLSLINGAAVLQFGSHDLVAVAGIERDEGMGARSQFILPQGIESAERFGTPTILLEGEEVPSRGISEGESCLQLSRLDPLVERALVMYGRLEHDWKNLYLVVEVIEDDVGGERALLNAPWATGYDVKLFKHTANSYLAIGADARHGTGSKAPPVSPMTLPDARDLVRGVLRGWLSKKGTGQSTTGGG